MWNDLLTVDISSTACNMYNIITGVGVKIIRCIVIDWGW